jgi:transcription termination factor NusB
MKLDTNNKTVTPSVDTVAHPTYRAQIDKSAAGLVMDILAKLYANPLAAAIREYTSNAIDAHVAAGVDRPVEVTLPSRRNQWLTVRDYGKGLTAFDILTVYANFGSSDKRDSDDFIGGFGIGSKSGLAISDAIYVNSWTDGKLNSFVIKRTTDGIITQFLQEDVDAPGVDTGTEVKVFVNRNYLNTTSTTAPGDDHTSWMYDMYMPLAGWSFKQVKVQHESIDLATFINENRIPDSWHEFEHGFVNIDTVSLPIKHGILVGSVFYNVYDNGKLDIKPLYEKIPTFKHKDGLLTQPFVLKLDIADAKVSYSREKILWRDSKKTRNAIARAITGLAEDIESAVNDIKACNLDVNDYVKRLMALKLNMSIGSSSSSYKSLLTKTPAFNIVKIMEIDHLRMDFYHTFYNEFSLFNTYNSKLIAPGRLKQYYITMDNQTPFDNQNTINEIRRVVRGIFNLDSSVVSSYPELKDIYSFVHDDNNYTREGRLDEQMTQFIIVHEKDFNKIPSVFSQQHSEFEVLRKAKNSAARKARKDAKPDKERIAAAQRVYTMNTNLPQMNPVVLEPIKENATYEEQRKTLLLPRKSQYAFKVKTIPVASQILAHTLSFDTILCAKTVSDFERMKTALPDAVVMTDDEISAAIASYLHERKWASQDEFCRQVFDELSTFVFADDDDPNKYSEDHCPACQMGIRINNERPAKAVQWTQYREISHIRRLITKVKSHKTTEPVLQDIFNMMYAMPNNMRNHQMTDDFRLLLSLCHATRTFMHRSEIDALVDKVKVQYDYEITHIKNLYR